MRWHGAAGVFLFAAAPLSEPQITGFSGPWAARTTLPGLAENGLHLKGPRRFRPGDRGDVSIPLYWPFVRAAREMTGGLERGVSIQCEGIR
jgi:hypothetical protein